MTASNFMEARDILVAKSVRERLELGYFDHQFIQYGAAYWKDGQVRYVVGDDNVQLSRRLHALDEPEKYATQVIRFMRDEHVPEGAMEIVETKVRAQNAKELRRRIPSEYFDIVRRVQPSSCDAACGVLEPIQEAIVGRSHEIYLNIFAGLVGLARERMQLTGRAYLEYLAWIDKERALIINRIAKKGRFSTTVQGFVYDVGGAPKLFATATESDLVRKRETLLAQSTIMSPVLSQGYTYDDHFELRGLRQAFMDMAGRYLNESYMGTVRRIYNLPSPISADAVRAADEAIRKADFGEDVALAWSLQCKRWGVDGAL